MNSQRHITNLLLLLSIITTLSCKSPSAAILAPKPAYASEGSLETNAPTHSASISSESSLLNLAKMSQEGFNLDWSTSLMYNDTVRNFYLLGDTVLLESNTNYLHALDRYTGHYKWIIKLNRPLDFEPTLMESTNGQARMIYCIAQNHLYAIDVTRASTGRELGLLRWKLPLEHTPSTAPYANEYFVAFGVEESNFITTVQTQTVSQGLNYVPTGLAWKRSLHGFISSRPASSSDKEESTLMVATEGGKIHGLKLFTGERLWEFPSNYHVGPFRAPLLVHNNQVLATSTDHTLYILDRNNGALLGKIVLDSPLVQSARAIGEMNIIKDKAGRKILNIENDLDIFVQSEGSTENPNGFFYHIKVDRIVNRDVDNVGISEQSEQVIYRRWVLDVNWKLSGIYEYLFRTHSHFYLKHHDTLVAVNRKNGKKDKVIELGDIPLIVHHDPTSKYQENRLFIATEQGGVYSLQLK